MAFKGSGTINIKGFGLTKKSKANTNPNDVQKDTGKVKQTKGVYPVILQARDI